MHGYAAWGQRGAASSGPLPTWVGHAKPQSAKYAVALAAAPKYMTRPSLSSMSWSNICVQKGAVGSVEPRR